ncbi:ParA family protein (plasmid) [Spirosoma taeanense]|uniref:ParA family protein n=1 Tax=Spirosoma taeanense TaxID=2735870 RepID=A0A6M5YHQ0_9BACT|nr:ParA family protein [Spirosoma taeanense]QJW92482.1 ParA family protein [Spirosoma taeanense]
MKTITILQQKGGVGKTTLALNIALYVAQTGAAVAMCDADAQGSLSAVSGMIEGLEFVRTNEVLARTVDADLLVIDTSPRNDAELSRLLSLTDFALIPVKPGFLDVLAMRDTIAILSDVQATRPDLKAGIVLNMVQHRNAINRDADEMLKSFDTELLPVRIGQRVAYARTTLTNGVGNSQDEKAKEEIDQLVTLIFDRL